MTAYVVMERAAGEPGSATEFVRDRFSIVAFIVPVIWLLWHRLWIEALAAFAAAAGIAALGTFAGLQNTAPLLSLLVSVFVAIEGPQLRIWALERRGWHQAGIIEADNPEDAELRHFARTSRRADPSLAAAVTRSAPSVPAKPPAASGPALGLLDYPGTR